MGTRPQARRTMGSNAGAEHKLGIEAYSVLAVVTTSGINNSHTLRAVFLLGTSHEYLPDPTVVDILLKQNEFCPFNLSKWINSN